MLDSGSNDVQQVCRREVQDNNLLGFVTMKVDGQEFNVEAVLPSALCRLINQMYSSQVVASVPTPTATVYAVNAVRHNSSNVVEASQLNSSAEATMSVDVTKVDIHSAEKQIDVNGRMHRQHRRSRSGSSSDEVEDSYTTTSRYNQHQQHSQSHRGKYVVEFEEQITSVKTSDMKKDGTYAVPAKAKSSSGKKEKHRVSSNGGHGVYFRLNEAQFGAVAIGSLTRTRIDLCNGSDNEVC